MQWLWNTVTLWFLGCVAAMATSKSTDCPANVQLVSFSLEVQSRGHPLHSAPLPSVVPSLTPVLQSREVSAAARMDVNTPTLIRAQVQPVQSLSRQIFIFSCELISCLCHTDAAESVFPAAATHNSDKQREYTKLDELETPRIYIEILFNCVTWMAVKSSQIIDTWSFD